MGYDHINRGTGRTTAGILSTIAKAIGSHGKTFTYVDHYPMDREATVMYARCIRDMCESLGLKKMSVWTENCVVYVRSELLHDRYDYNAKDKNGNDAERLNRIAYILGFCQAKLLTGIERVKIFDFDKVDAIETMRFVESQVATMIAIAVGDEDERE